MQTLESIITIKDVKNLNDVQLQNHLRHNHIKPIKEALLNEAARRAAKQYILNHGQDLGINKKHLDNKLEIVIG
tara:strand:- start:52 stop:273 length:222 start_codon:yes stop_codon:yes gene_type:complete